MANELSKVERDELAKQAAGRPVTYAAPAAVLLIGAFTGLLLPGIVLAIVAFFVSMGIQVDRAAKQRTGGTQARPRRGQPQYAPEIQSEIDKAHATQRAIDEAIANADHPFEEIQEDVKLIVSAMETSAKRAQMIFDTLHDQSQAGHDERAIQTQIEKLRPRFGEKEVRELVNDLEAQRASHVKLRESLERFKINMARLNASLGLMRNRLIEMSAAEEATIQRELTEQAREIRDRTERFTRVLLETSDNAGGDDLQRELERDAAAKRAGGEGPTVIPMRNRATPPPEPRARAPAPRPRPRRRAMPRRARCRCATARSATAEAEATGQAGRRRPASGPAAQRGQALAPPRDGGPQNEPPPIDTRKK